MYYANRRKAIQICSECPVKAACGDAGLFEEAGIWGGMDLKDRRKERRLRNLRKDGRPLVPPSDRSYHPDCGTERGYQYLRRAAKRAGREPFVCRKCMKGHAKANSINDKKKSDVIRFTAVSLGHALRR